MPEAGEQLAAELGERLEAVERAVEGARRPRVAALEWLDPIFIGGHWVPQMIELAGGEDVLGLPGEKSRTAEWGEVEAVAPEVVVSMPCGYYAEQAAAETIRWRRHLAPARRSRGRGRRRRLLLAARAAAGGRRGAARPPAAPRAGAGPAVAALDRAGPGARRRRSATAGDGDRARPRPRTPRPAQSRLAACRRDAQPVRQRRTAPAPRARRRSARRCGRRSRCPRP